MTTLPLVSSLPSKKSTCFVFALVVFSLLMIVYDYETMSIPVSNFEKNFNRTRNNQWKDYKEENPIPVNVPFKEKERNDSNQSEISEIKTNVDIRIQSSLNVTEDKRLIDTPGCFLPETVLLPKKFSMKKDNGPNCSFEERLVIIDDTNEVLSLLTEGHSDAYNCTVIDIIRHPKHDSFVFGDEVAITDTLNINQKELFATKCGPLINFDAHFPIKTEIQEKIDFWKNKETPISVLFMGFDTTSRSHYHRSLVKTLPLMTKMGFVDFKGHHSVAPYTLQDFLSFLVGLTTAEVRASCAASWSSSFDTCPLIWKSFDLNNFITMYIEDGSQTFNWGGQGGFGERPTDYYPHPLFGSVGSLRRKYNDTKHGSCMSTMNTQQWMLDYNIRFLKKFKTTPFFSFTWFANPFHDSTYSLHGFDDQFVEFFQFLNLPDSASLRENTLMILNADHGERSGEFVKTGYEGFIERSLPGLFIRVPENLVKRHPEFDFARNLKINSERLTGGYDIHHTLLHLLHMQDLDILKTNSSPPFRPVFRDRSSLFVPVSDQRSCDDINVLTGNCVCNTSSQSSTIDNPFFTNKLVNFALKELNDKIKSSKYKDVCKSHGKPMLSFLLANIVHKTVKFTDTVLRFITSQDRAQFEVQLRVFHENTTMDRLERIGPFNRLNVFGNTSWCVDFVTDEDKRMKEICSCKSITKSTTSTTKKPSTRSNKSASRSRKI